jgi:hypothetical protein
MASTVHGSAYVTSPWVTCSRQKVSETKFDTSCVLCTTKLKSEEYRLPGYDAMSSGSSPTFQRNITYPRSGSKSKPSKYSACSVITCTVDHRRGLVWMLDLLTNYYTRPETTRNYMAIANLQNLRITTAPDKTFSRLLCLHQPFPGNGF